MKEISPETRAKMSQAQKARHARANHHPARPPAANHLVRVETVITLKIKDHLPITLSLDEARELRGLLNDALPLPATP